ncbi:MAG: MFS transporter [Pseudomonadota bacterium]
MSDGLPLPRRNWASLAMALSVALVILESAIVNVALPVIAREFAVTAATSIWIVSAYQMVVAMALLPLAALGDKFGFRRVYLGGLLLFTLASAACALATSLPMLVAFRMLQALGGAGVMSVNMTLVHLVYPTRLLGRGISLNASVAAIASAAGPTIASLILSGASWPWLFAVNLPLGLLALLISWKALPDSARASRPYDTASALLNAITFGALLLAFGGMANSQPWSVSAAELFIAAVFGTVFVRRQLSRPAPLLPVDLLRIPMFALSVGTSFCSSCAQMIALISLPFFLGETLHRPLIEIGFMMTPWALMVAITAPFAGVLSDRYPAGILCALGLALTACGMALLAALEPASTNLDICWRMAVCGIGIGFFQTPNNRAMMASAPQGRISGASGMLGTTRLLGFSCGAALAALMFTLFNAQGAVSGLMLAAGIAATGALVSSLRLAATMKR